MNFARYRTHRRKPVKFGWRDWARITLGFAAASVLVLFLTPTRLGDTFQGTVVGTAPAGFGRYGLSRTDLVVALDDGSQVRARPYADSRAEAGAEVRVVQQRNIFGGLVAYRVVRPE